MHAISNLADCREHGPIIAERIWNAWWKDAGHLLSDVVDHLSEMLDPRSLPLALVARDDNGGYAGSAFLIECDLAERPQYKPWIAALWVEEHRRGQGIAAALLREGTERAALLGHAAAYLCCRRPLEGFYVARGWSMLERDVGEHGLSVLIHWRKDVARASRDP